MAALVSAIVPTFNRGEAMRPSIESILEQTYRPLELVIVDDGSTNDTPQVIQRMGELAREQGIEFQTMRQDNAGAPAARNAGMAIARGDFFAHLDDDDRWYPTKLEKQIAELERTGADLCACYVVRNSVKGTSSRMPSKGRPLLGQGTPSDIIEGRSSAHINSLVHTRRMIDQYGGFDAGLRNCFDHEFMTRMALLAKTCQVEEVLATYDCRQDSLTRSAAWEKQLRKNNYRIRMAQTLKEKLSHLPAWDEEAWRKRAGMILRQIIKHYLWRVDFAGAREKLALQRSMIGDHPAYREMRRRYWKYRVLAAIGFPVKKDRWSDSGE